MPIFGTRKTCMPPISLNTKSLINAYLSQWQHKCNIRSIKNVEFVAGLLYWITFDCTNAPNVLLLRAQNAASCQHYISLLCEKTKLFAHFNFMENNLQWTAKLVVLILFPLWKVVITVILFLLTDAVHQSLSHKHFEAPFNPSGDLRRKCWIILKVFSLGQMIICAFLK